ncbi:MAG: dTDP-4-dehydrorhamnose reductase [Candidatus Hydrogenedentes bacterium]|nr:dTDP-4-dehydrorhamnose reductase [Candidatus Hydrogenedentota bacterium]
MRTLIFGAKGQLGRDLVAEFEEAGPVTGVDLPEVDVAQMDQVRAAVAEWRPDLVLNAAAYTDVEGAEADPQGAFRTNEFGAACVARAAAEAGAPVVYYSTDFVFSGDHTTPYEPFDPVAPQGEYAASKAAGETATREAAPSHFIIRTAWLYGPGGNNFVEKILRAAAERPVLRVVEDEVGSPTHTLDLAQATRALCGTAAYGTFHAVNAGSCSRYEFAQAILALAGLETSVEPCRASAFPTKAPRPAYSVLATEALTEASGFAMRPWHDALRDYMARREATA